MMRSKIFSITLVVITMLLVEGCATRPYRLHIPEVRIYNKSVLAPHEGTGKVTIERDTGFIGSACAVALHVDYVKTAIFGMNEMLTLYLPEGRQNLGLSCIHGFIENEIEVDVKQSRPLRFLIGFIPLGGPKLIPISY